MRKDTIQTGLKTISRMEQDIKEIHDVVYKDGLVTQVRINAEKIERLIKNLDKAIWMILALIIGFLGEFIWSLVQGP